jgi:hypothetical protein
MSSTPFVISLVILNSFLSVVCQSTIPEEIAGFDIENVHIVLRVHKLVSHVVPRTSIPSYPYSKPKPR